MVPGVCDLNAKNGCQWSNLADLTLNIAAQNVDQYSGTITQTGVAVGTYLYGMHILDQAGNRAFEPQTQRVAVTTAVPVPVPVPIPDPTPVPTPVPVNDTVKPELTAFSAAVNGSSVILSFTGSDSGGSHIEEFQVYRATVVPGVCDLNAKNGCQWSNLADLTLNIAAQNVDQYSGTITQTGVAVGTYLYGMHILDQAGNRAFEPQTQRVAVTTAVPDPVPVPTPVPVNDTVKPRLTVFTAQGIGSSVKMSFTGTDSGGSHISDFRVLRAKVVPGVCDDSTKSGCVWERFPAITLNIAALNLDAYSGSITQTAVPVGSYFYGMHIYDQAGNMNFEPKAQKVSIVP